MLLQCSPRTGEHLCAVGWDAVLNAGRLQVRFPVGSLWFFVELILPAVLWPCCRLSFYQKWVPGMSSGGQRRPVCQDDNLTTSCAGSLELLGASSSWWPMPCPGQYRDSLKQMVLYVKCSKFVWLPNYIPCNLNLWLVVVFFLYFACSTLIWKNGRMVEMLFIREVSNSCVIPDRRISLFY